MKTLILSIFLILTMNAYSEREFKIYDTKKEEVIDFDDFVKKSTKFDVIFFGEFHDDSLIHVIQKDYLKQMYAENDNITVSLEMFERDVQEYINKYLADAISEDEFLENSRPWNDYKEFYRPLVELAKKYNSDLIASNIPRKYAGMFAMGGFSGINMLPPAEKAYIAKEMVMKDDDYKTKFFTTMLGNKNRIKSLSYNEENTLWLYYGAQSIKDETMAESIKEHFEKNPDKQIIHFNGDFHSNSYLGTAQKLMERDDNIKVAVITPVYSKNAEVFGENRNKEADFVIFLDDFVRKDKPMEMGEMHLGENYVKEHHIDVEIVPTESKIIAKDSLVLKNPIFRKSSVKLLNTLEINDVKAYKGNIKWEVKPIDDLYNEIVFTNTSFDEQEYGKSGIIEANNIVISYSGKVYNKPSQTNLVERHSRSAGIISPEEKEGFYLPGASYYPATDEDMADFYATITVPEPYHVITSGNITQKSIDGKKIYTAKTEFALDNLIIVGGKYFVETTEIDGIKLNVYTYEKSQTAKQYLSSLEKTYKFYTNLFGEYPFESFSVVENFFSTGFGMPGYTLLGSRLMAMPWVTMSPGSLPHEFVHNWWGNSVFVDYDKGNWCEALTTFSANYYYNTIDNDEAALRDWRKKALISLDALPADKNYPLSEFEYQKDKFDAVIGYEKGGMMFYEIYKLMGDEHFFAVLKDFAKKYRGKKATWRSLTRSFSGYVKEKELDLPVAEVFDQWLNSTELPYISISRVNVDGSNATFTIKMSHIYNMKIPVRFKGNGQEKTEYFYIDEQFKEYNFNPGFNVEEIRIDPNYEVLRTLHQWEKPYTFSRTLGAEPIVITPEKNTTDYRTAQSFMQLLRESGYSFEEKSQDDITPSDYQNKSVILLGNIKNNKLIKEAVQKLPENFVFSDNEVTMSEDKTVKSSDYVMLINSDHPTNQRQLCTILYYDNMSMVSPLERFFHYTSYSMVALKIGQRGRPFYDIEIFPSGYSRLEMIWDIGGK
jgi:aminopeptidase N